MLNRSKVIFSQLLKAIKMLVMSSYLVCLYEKVPEENRLASILIAREVLMRISEVMLALECVYKELRDIHVKRAIEELHVAYKLLNEIAYGNVSDVRVLRRYSYREVSYPLLLDDAHHHIHNSITELRKSRSLDERLKRVLQILEKARRDTAPMELYKRAYELLKEK